MSSNSLTSLTIEREHAAPASWAELVDLFGVPVTGTWKRMLWTRVETSRGERNRTRTFDNTSRDAQFAQWFLDEHAERELFVTPNLFVNKKRIVGDSGRPKGLLGKEEQVAWVGWLQADVDGVINTNNAEDARQVIADELMGLGVPAPTIAMCTSEIPGNWEYAPHFRLLWRVNPIYTRKPDGRELAKDAQEQLVHAINQSKRLKVDLAKARTLGNSLAVRVSGSVNKGVVGNPRVRIVGPVHDSSHDVLELKAHMDEIAPARPRRRRTRASTGSATAPQAATQDAPEIRDVRDALPMALRGHPAIETALSQLSEGVRHNGALTLGVGLYNSPRCANERIYDLLASVVSGYDSARSGDWGVRGDDKHQLRHTVNGIINNGYVWEEETACMRMGVANPGKVGVYAAGRQTRRSRSRPAAESESQRDCQPRRPRRRLGRPRERRGERYAEAVVDALKTRSTITWAEIAEHAGVATRTVKANADMIRAHLRIQWRLHLHRRSHGFLVIREAGKPQCNGEVQRIRTSHINLRGVPGGGVPAGRSWATSGPDPPSRCWLCRRRHSGRCCPSPPLGSLGSSGGGAS